MPTPRRRRGQGPAPQRAERNHAATIAPFIRHHIDDRHQPQWAATGGRRPLLLDDFGSEREADAGRRHAVVARRTVGPAARDAVPFFILHRRLARSGTSRSSRMLNEHPGLGEPFETTIVAVFHDMADAYGPLDDSDNRRRPMQPRRAISAVG